MLSDLALVEERGFPLVLFLSTVNALERARDVQRKHGKHPNELEVTE
jgi:hypothetical protein